MNTEQIEDAIALVDIGPQKTAQWLDAAHKMMRHCRWREGEDVDQAAARILADEVRQLRTDNTKLRKALVGLVGADGLELDGMEALIRISPHAPEEDRAVTINAIHALRETL